MPKNFKRLKPSRNLKKLTQKHIFILVITFVFIALNFSKIYSVENGTKNILSQDTQVHFIDVGQGDSSLIISGGEAILIDGGPNSKEDFMVDYLKNIGIEKIKLVIATHPHEDHIGGLDAVIREIPTQEILMTNQVHSTKTYSDLLDAIENTSTKLTIANPAMRYNFESGAYMDILAPHPDDEFDEINDYSIVTRLEAGKNSILFTGDMEKAAESSLLLSGTLLKSDIIKISHHGSKTSSSAAFMRAVSPKMAIISLGKDNKYGHPNTEVTDYLTKNNIPIRRTDNEGSIIYKFEVQND